MRHKFGVTFFNGNGDKIVLTEDVTFVILKAKGKTFKGVVDYVDSFELQKIGISNEETGSTDYVFCHDVEEIILAQDKIVFN